MILVPSKTPGSQFLIRMYCLFLFYSPRPYISQLFFGKGRIIFLDSVQWAIFFPSTCLITSSEAMWICGLKLGISFLIYHVLSSWQWQQTHWWVTWTGWFWQAFLKAHPIYSLFHQPSKHFSEQAIIHDKSFFFSV